MWTRSLASLEAWVISVPLPGIHFYRATHMHGINAYGICITRYHMTWYSLIGLFIRHRYCIETAESVTKKWSYSLVCLDEIPLGQPVWYIFVAELTFLESRRDQLSRSFFQDISHPSSSLYHLLPLHVIRLSCLGSEQPRSSCVLSHETKILFLY